MRYAPRPASGRGIPWSLQMKPNPRHIGVRGPRGAPAAMHREVFDPGGADFLRASRRFRIAEK
jgi:hypothetical protein